MVTVTVPDSPLTPSKPELDFARFFSTARRGAVQYRRTSLGGKARVNSAATMAGVLLSAEITTTPYPDRNGQGGSLLTGVNFLHSPVDTVDHQNAAVQNPMYKNGIRSRPGRKR